LIVSVMIRRARACIAVQSASSMLAGRGRVNGS
jgi:hypothetical protein